MGEMSLLDEVKSDLFTLRGTIVTLINNLILLGLGAAVLLVYVNMGNDVALTVVPDVPAVKTRK